MLGGEPAESRESGVIGRHPGAQLGQDVALLSIRREHASGPEHREIAGDFERADRAARHEDPLPAVALGILVGLRVDRAAFTAETGKPWNVRHEGLLVPAGGEHDMCECLPDRGTLRGARLNRPETVLPPDSLDGRLRAHLRHEAVRLGVSGQVRQHILVSGIDMSSRRVREVAEGGQDARGVRAHRGPDAAAARIPRPLTADAPASIEDDRLEAFALEVSRGDEPRRPRPDDRHLRH